MSKTFLTDQNNDLYLDTNNRLAIATRNIDVAAEVTKNKLRTFLGEIFTDKTLGVDYFGIIFNDYSNLQDKINEIGRVCLQVDLTQSIESIAYTQDKPTGTISFNPTIVVSGENVTIEHTVG
jgi:hypothetical protein